MADETDPITKEDLDQGLRAVVGEVEERAEASARRLLPVAIGAGVALLVVAYLIGRRVGKTKSTVVEIRRI